MAGKIIADTIEASGSQISLNVGNVTVLTASSTGLTLIPTSNVNINVTNSTLAFGAGNVSFPSITTSGDTNTGLYFPAADTIAFSEGGAEVMRIDSSGNVGIGTASPIAPLHIVNGAASAPAIYLQNGNKIGFTAAQSCQFGTWNGTTYTENMRIDSSGNLLVGTTTQIGAEQVGISFADTTKNGLGIQVQASTSGAGFVAFRNSSGTLIGSITRNTTTNAVLYNTSSDYRLKENITPLTNALARVSALKPVQWLWKDCDGVVGEGFIAHEVQDVIPAAVSGEKDAIDGEGNIKPQGMDASYLVATLTAAIQELKVIVDAQAVEIAALKAK